MKTQKTFTCQPGFDPEIKVGDEVVIVSIEGQDGRVTYEPRIAPEGIGGNMDEDVKRYHGWRGTTNNVSVSAHGLRRVLKIEAGDMLKVTVGPDLHPDWA